VVAWATGLPFIFPSLGPSAYVLATRPTAAGTQPRRVVGSHLVGVLAGLVAYHAVAPNAAVTATRAPFSTEGLRVALSGVVATGLTAAGMLATDLVHPPACATTLIVSLGLLPTVPQAAGIVLAVVILVAVDAGRRAVRRRGAVPTS
jgi:CBS-domain-containing membrane protein